VYTKKGTNPPDFDEPVILTKERGGVTVESFCNRIHKDFKKDLKFARVWGQSAKHNPQT